MIWLGMDPFDSLRGHYGLQTASEIRSDLRFEISDLDYLHIHVHIAYMFWAHFVASAATTASKTASEVRSDLRFGIYGPNFICYHVCLDSLGLFWHFF